jgi:isopenicillin N synthase-like dioxygenase
MAHSSLLPPGPRTIPTVDLTPFTTNAEPPSLLDSQRLKAGKALVETLHDFGFVKVTGHGFSKREIDEALDWTKKLFDLPEEDKMKAPHPAGGMPHRGYSSIGKEKIYSEADAKVPGSDDNVSQESRNISDYKVRGIRPHSLSRIPYF